MDQRALAAQVGVSRQWVINREKGRPGAGLGLVFRALGILGLRLSLERAPGREKLRQPFRTSISTR